ncbi:hypothetical protein [Xenorhabdus bovienii]|uniref:hypothetical protein n=1 Tax=Xenorhabdus bovienii TaxID=40576 RepID=UPI0023B2DCA9|nr:hypothetical protein [Xenorhabdus bovienii]MDE9433502.1 hypothetical protein [Xenorhabdus bovienii]MDE9491142.1 hypothetical protein [Xenorhabdus bovienii]MDE9507460.1 hypothetical protein [Xenorhabdus bovienii]
MKGSCLSPEVSLWLGKFVPDEFVIPLPLRCNLKSIVYASDTRREKSFPSGNRIFSVIPYFFTSMENIVCLRTLQP